MSNRAPGEQTEANERTHDCARGGTTVLQAQKGGTASSTAMLVTVHGRTVARAGTHGRALLAFHDILSGFDYFGGAFWWGGFGVPQLGFLSPSLKPH